MPPRFSLIVSTIGRTDDLRELFVSLMGQRAADFEVIVIDQSSNDQVARLCADFRDRLQIVHEKMEIRGVSRGRNQGLSLARGEIIGFPDDDCSLPESVLEDVSAFFDQNPGVDILCGSSCERDTDRSVTRFHALAQSITRENVLVTSVEFATFSRRRVFDTLRYDESMGVGSTWGSDEGPDLILRALDLGFVAQYEPGLVVHHPCPVLKVDAKTLSRSFSYAQGRGRLLRKHHYPFATVAHTGFRSLAGCILYLVMLNQPRSEYYWRAFRGLLIGYFAEAPAEPSQRECMSSPTTRVVEADPRVPQSPASQKTLPFGAWRQRGVELLKQDLVRKFFPALFVRGFGALAAICMSLLVTRTVPPSEAGLFFIAFALVQTCGRIVSLGAPEMTLRVVSANYVSDWRAVNHNVSGTFKLVGKVGAAVALVMAIGAQPIAETVFQKPALAPLLVWIGLSSLALALIQVVAAALQAKQLVLTSSFSHNFLGPALFLGAVAVCKAGGVTLDALRLVFIYASALGLALCCGLGLWFRDPRTRIDPRARLSGALKASIASMFVVVSMDMAVQWSGYLATTTFLSEESVALFATAHRTAMINSFLLIGVNLIVAPKFAHAFAERDLTEVDSLALLSSRIMLACATPMLLCMLVFPETIMGLFGAEYVKAAPYLQVLAVGQFINLMTGSVCEILAMTGHEKDFRNIVLVTGPLSIALAVGLTSQLGTTGAALATAFSVATQNLLAVLMVKKRLGFNTMNLLRTPIANPPC